MTKRAADRHPDVKQQRAHIRELEKEHARLRDAFDDPNNDTVGAPEAQQAAQDLHAAHQELKHTYLKALDG